VLRAFFSRPRSSSSCPMSAQKAITSASYFSLIHDSRTEVSNPPEYAKTIFIGCDLTANGPKRRCRKSGGSCRRKAGPGLKGGDTFVNRSEETVPAQFARQAAALQDGEQRGVGVGD